MWHTNPLRELYACTMIAGGILIALGAIIVYLVSVARAKEVLWGE